MNISSTSTSYEYRFAYVHKELYVQPNPTYIYTCDVCVCGFRVFSFVSLFFFSDMYLFVYI